ncbi:MAG: hypothetical protein ACRDV6_08585 [Acidimicrobiales bacterium]
MADDNIEQRLRRTLHWMADRAEEPTRAARTRRPHARPGGVGLYLDDEVLTTRRRVSRPVLFASAAVLLIAIGVPVVLVAAGGGPGRTPGAPSVPDAAAKSKIVSALGATTATGNWDVSYTYTETFGTSTGPQTTTTQPCPEPLLTTPTTVLPAASQGGSGLSTGLGCVSSGPTEPSQPVKVTGTGVIDVDPKAMVAVADVSNFGHVVLRIDGSDVWEFLSGSGDRGGLAPDPGGSAGSGQALPGYAGLVESTLGTREGATAMLGIASPTGYLELDENAITGVTPAGTGTLNGDPVTEYHVAVNPSELADDPTATPAEVTTIQAAVAKLVAEGLTHTTEDVAVDAQGFIVQSITTYAFSNGGTVVVQGDYSSFGCAGTVSMPGQSGPSEPPANCVSPDSPSPTTTTTTTTTTTSTSTSSSTTTTTTPSSTATTVTTPSGK